MDARATRSGPPPRGLRRGLAAALACVALDALVGGCATVRSQLLDPHPATPEVAAEALEQLRAAPLPAEHQAQIALETRGQVFVAVALAEVAPPDAFHLVLAAPFGVTLLEVQRDAAGAEVVSAAEPLRRALTLGRFPRLLGLWLLGDCGTGEVWQGLNGIAVDCAAGGPDQGLTWRIWVDHGVRVRGELLQGRRLLGDYTCDAAGTCVLQDPVHGYALRILPAR